MNKELREMLASIEDKKAEARALVNENKIVEAKAMKTEIAEMQDKFELMKDLLENEMGEVENMIEITDSKVENKADAEVVAFNKAVLGKPLTEAQNALIEKVGEDGGFLVPVEQQNQIHELKRELKSLKDYCNVIPVGSMSGTMPIEVGASDELIDFDEMTEINQSTIKFGQVKFEVKNVGDIIPVSNSLLADEKANLTSFIGKRFAKKAVRTENKKIIDIVKTAKNIGVGQDESVIVDALNISLDPAISDMSIVLTNQTGYNYLDKLEDKNGQPLLSEDMSKPGAKFFKGREIVRVSDSVLPLVKKTVQVDDGKGGKVDKEVSNMTFYVGDLAEMVTFFDRQGYEIAVSTEAGFTKNATYMRVIERFDVKPVDKEAMVNVEITLQ